MLERLLGVWGGTALPKALLEGSRLDVTEYSEQLPFISASAR